MQKPALKEVCFWTMPPILTPASSMVPWKLSFRQVGIHAREARKHPRTDSEEASVGIRLLAWPRPPKRSHLYRHLRVEQLQRVAASVLPARLPFRLLRMLCPRPRGQQHRGRLARLPGITCCAHACVTCICGREHRCGPRRCVRRLRVSEHLRGTCRGPSAVAAFTPFTQSDPSALT